MTRYITATQARKSFFKLIELLQKSGDTIMITHQDKPPVVMMPAEEWEGWMETLEIMSDPDLMKDLREGMRDTEEGRVHSLEEVAKELNLESCTPSKSRKRRKSN